MSLDLYMNPKPCPHCGRSKDADDLSFNITYNLSPMWCKATKDEKLIFVDGMTGKESIPKLEMGLGELKSNPDKYKRYSPENGWGNYEVLVQTIEKILKCAKNNPDGKWDSWR